MWERKITAGIEVGRCQLLQPTATVQVNGI